MYSGKLVFAQVMEHLPLHVFRQCVARYAGRYPTLSFSYLDQFLCMSFAQLTCRASLRDIETCLRAHGNKLYHLGIRGNIARSTLADANEKRDWRIWHDLAMHLIGEARALYAGDAFGVELDNTIYALDTTTIDLCLSVFPWARFRSTKAAVKLHTLLDLRGNIPTFIHISDGKMHEVNVLDQLPVEAGSFYLMDRGFMNFARLHTFTRAGAFFVIRAKHNLQYQRIASHIVDKTTGLRSDQTIRLAGIQSIKAYPDTLRRVSFYDDEHKKKLVFLTNNHELPALIITQLYKQRWQVEMFFKWIKQHLRIKAFFGTSQNAVKTQVWIAIATYVLIAILKKRSERDASLYTILQILSLSLFEKIPLQQLLDQNQLQNLTPTQNNQLNLFD
jgi:hypothetical protein